MVVSVIIALILGANIYSVLTTSQTMEELKRNDIERTKEQEYIAIMAIVDENIDKAKVQADIVKDSAEKDILKAYPNKDALKHDLSVIGDYPIYHILKSNIQGKFLNVKNDNNDMNVWTKLGKVADTSHNCAFELGEVFTIDNEIAKQNNKPLARIAINGFMNQTNKDYSFWMYLPTPDGYYLPVKMDESELQKLFDKYGAKGFEYVEFLTASYLRQDSDIFGIEDIDQNGIKTDNDKIVFIQGFNVYDDLKANHADLLQYYESTIKNTEDKYDTINNNLKGTGILITIILLLGFIGIARGVSKV